MWQSAYSWKTNPFDIKPNPELVGVEEAKQRLLEHATSGDACHLFGDLGLGKTSLLFWLKGQLKGYTPVYLNSAYYRHPQQLELKLQQNRSLADRLLLRKFPSKRFVLLIDEAQNLDGKVAEVIKALYDEDKVSSCVFASVGSKLDNLPASILSRIGRRRLQLKKLTMEQGLTLIKTRLKGMRSPFANESVMSELVRRGNYEPRKILELCGIVCQHSAPKARVGDLIKEADLADILDRDERYLTESARHLSETTESGSRPEPIEAEFRLSETSKTTESVSRLTQRGKSGSQMRLSEMQKEIVRLLAKGPKTVDEIGKALKSSTGSVGKQLSVLSNPIPEKNIAQPIVQIVSQKRPKQYGLTEWGKKQLK
jgi:hypothetical protein